MSFYAKMKRGSGAMLATRSGVPGVANNGVAGFLVDKGERYAGASLFGFLKGYYRDKAMVRGIPVDVLAGGALTVVGAILSGLSGGTSQLAPHLNRFGDAGVMSYLNSRLAGYGMKKAGRSVYVLDGTAPGALPAGMKKVDMLGAIPAAMGGAYLSADEIAKYADRR